MRGCSVYLNTMFNKRSDNGDRKHHQTVPLAVLLKRELAPEKPERSEIVHGQANQSKKGEDFTMVNTDCQRVLGDGSTTFSVFALFDGHNGSAAPIYAKEYLMKNILSAIPSDLNRDEWIAALPRSMVAGFVKTDKEFQETFSLDYRNNTICLFLSCNAICCYTVICPQSICGFVLTVDEALFFITSACHLRANHFFNSGFCVHNIYIYFSGQMSGTSVTFVIIDGSVISVASVGDSRCIVEPAEGGVHYLSADHRLESSEDERLRITSSGGEVGKLNTGGGTEIGPLRCWPGGLCLSRSIGDTDVGEFIVPVPYVKQMKLSTAGGRLIISSDGVWDILSAEEAFDCCRGMPPDAAAAQIVKDAVGRKGLQDDTTCIVIDILPQEKTAPPLAPPKKHGKGGVLNKLFKKKSSEKSSSVEQEYHQPDTVEEMFEEGSASLSQRLDSKYPLCNMFKLFTCAICQVEIKPGEGISIHSGSSSNPEKSRHWDGPFLCASCQKKREAMEGKGPSRNRRNCDSD